MPWTISYCTTSQGLASYHQIQRDSLHLYTRLAKNLVHNWACIRTSRYADTHKWEINKVRHWESLPSSLLANRYVDGAHGSVCDHLYKPRGYISLSTLVLSETPTQHSLHVRSSTCKAEPQDRNIRAHQDCRSSAPTSALDLFCTRVA